MPDDKLLPCPFCGRTDVEEIILDEKDRRFIRAVCCNNGCGACGPFSAAAETDDEAIEYAIRKWNERAA